jgi:hypothetical protein
MCNNSSRWGMSQLDHAGLVGISPANAVTFIDNHDTDLSLPVIWNKLLGYAYILTSEGYPCVFYKDYSTDHGCYRLKPAIDNLIWIHENLAFGSTIARFKDFQAIVYERQGFPNLLVGLDSDRWRLGTRRGRETRARARGCGRQDQRRGKLVSLIGGERASRERVAAVLVDQAERHVGATLRIERPLNDDHFVDVHGRERGNCHRRIVLF